MNFILRFFFIRYVSHVGFEMSCVQKRVHGNGSKGFPGAMTVEYVMWDHIAIWKKIV